MFTPDLCHPTPPRIRGARQDAGQARKCACCVVGAPKFLDSANKLIRCWNRGVVVRGVCCVLGCQSSAAASSSPQRCSSAMGSHWSPLRSNLRLACIAASCNARRRMASTAPGGKTAVMGASGGGGRPSKRWDRVAGGGWRRAGLGFRV